MRGRSGYLIVYGALLSVSGGVSSAAAPSAASRCHVLGGEALPPESGGIDAICLEVNRAIAAQAPGAAYSAEIKVLSPSRLAATLIVDGRTLPVQNFAVMDGKLGTASIVRFASALARAVAEAVKS